MINNAVLRSLRFSLNIQNTAVAALFTAGGLEVTKEQVINWLKKDEEAGFISLTDTELARFLNGLIISRRGAREGGIPEPEKRLNNNIILRKMRIAFELKDEDILDMLQYANFRLGKSELSAFFRRPEHPHYRLCQDQILRNFLRGLQQRLRPQDS